MTSRQRVHRLTVLIVVLIAPGAMPTSAAITAPSGDTARLVLLFDTQGPIEQAPRVFDIETPLNRSMSGLVDLNAIAGQLIGGPALAQSLMSKFDIAAEDFHFNRLGVQGRLRFLGNPDPFIAHDLELTNTTDQTIRLFYLLELPTVLLDPNISLAAELNGTVFDRMNEPGAILTYEQLVTIGLSNGDGLGTPIGFSGAAVDGSPILEMSAARTIPTDQPITAITLQTNLTLTPGDTALLSGHLAAGNSEFRIINGQDTRILLDSAVIPEPGELLLLCGLGMMLSPSRSRG